MGYQQDQMAQMLNSAPNRQIGRPLSDVGQTDPEFEIDREIRALHDRLSLLDEGMAKLGCRLSQVMRAPETEKGDNGAALNPLTPLGTLIRSASARVDVHIEIVSDILRRLEIQ